jgi:hypothetical protein
MTGGPPTGREESIVAKDLLKYQLLFKSALRGRGSISGSTLEPDLTVSMELDATEMIKRFVPRDSGCRLCAPTSGRVDSGKRLRRSGPNRWCVRLVDLPKRQALSRPPGFIQVILDHAQDERRWSRLPW